MTENIKSKTGWLLTRVWLNALEQTARDFHGTRPKEFCMRAYEHATNSWLRVLEDEMDILTAKADTLKQAIENYIHVGISVGLFPSEQIFDLEEQSSGAVKVSVYQCPYQASCKDLLDSKTFTFKTLTCARIGCFRAACNLLTNMESSYDIIDIKPGVKCEGIITPE